MKNMNQRLLAVITGVVVVSFSTLPQAQACSFKAAVGFAGPDLAKMEKPAHEVKVLVFAKAGNAAGQKLFAKANLGLLSRMGYQVAVVDNEKDATAAAKTGQYKVIMAAIDDAKSMQGNGAKVVAYSQTLNDSQRGPASEYAAAISSDSSSSILDLVTALKKSG